MTKEQTWQPITQPITRKVIVTNNIEARDANGQLSHVWVVGMVHRDPNHGGFSAFNEADRRLWGLTHYAEIPAVQ